MSKYGLSPISNPVKVTVLSVCFECLYDLWAGKLILASLYPHLSTSDVTGGYFKRFSSHIPSQTGDWFLIWLHIRAFMYFIAYNEGIDNPFCTLIPFSYIPQISPRVQQALSTSIYPFLILLRI